MVTPTVRTECGAALRELTAEEIREISGAGLFYDLGHWVGDTLGGLKNRLSEQVHNEPFQRVYG